MRKYIHVFRNEKDNPFVTQWHIKHYRDIKVYPFEDLRNGKWKEYTHKDSIPILPAFFLFNSPVLDKD